LKATLLNRKEVRYISVNASGESVCRSDMSNMRKTSQDAKNREPFWDGFFSALFAAINSGKFWRCIRWCDEGSTVLITSPGLFEREVLQSEGWKLQHNINNFTNFVALLKQLGFKQLVNQRPSKVQKFRHPQFTKDCRDILTEATKRYKTQRKRKMPENENPKRNSTCPAKEKNQERNLAQRSKRQRKFNFDSGNESAKTAMKRKRKAGNSSEISTPVKKQKSAVTANVPISKGTPSQMRGIYSAEEMTAAQALLSLSTPVVFANYTAMELMAAQCLIDLSRSSVVPRRRTVQELEAAQSLLELAKSAKF